MLADLTKTEWVPAAEVHVGDRLVDWHDENGRSVFGFDPLARRIVERYERLEPHALVVEFVITNDEGFRSRVWKQGHDRVEVQR